MDPLVSPAGSNNISSATITFFQQGRTVANNPIYDSSNQTAYNNFIEKIALHEIGHTVGIQHPMPPESGNLCDEQDGGSVMNGYCGTNDRLGNMPLDIPTCDKDQILNTYPPPPPPTATGCYYSPWDYDACTAEYGNYDTARCVCERGPQRDLCGGTGRERDECLSPIVIDVDGDGFALTDAQHGVFFDLTSDGVAERLSWTAADADDAWLCLDRDGDGQISVGREMFGNFTAQPEEGSDEPHGFRALASFDRAGLGGNSDGAIDAKDAVFHRLRLWQDANHNGISEAWELHSLPTLDVAVIELDYKESKYVDAHGNEFRYRAKVRDAQGKKVGKWAYDVFLVSAP